MRKIDYDPAKLALPEGWAEQAAKLAEQLAKEEDPKKRAEIIDKNQIWADLRPLLRDIMNGKCWYTESPQEGTDVDIDHFRPKKRVAELVEKDPPHHGYWWLTYDHSNYRYSCIIANRRRKDVETGKTGGKADHFPVWNEENRAYTPNCDCGAEKSLLIDPCKEGEPALITFKDDGEAMPRFPDTHEYKYAKADTSIRYYNINHTDFVNARIALRDKIEELRREARRLFARLDTGDADHERSYQYIVGELRKMCDKTSPHSSFCETIIAQHRYEDYMFGIFT